jgi:hypothetical protein
MNVLNHPVLIIITILFAGCQQNQVDHEENITSNVPVSTELESPETSLKRDTIFFSEDRTIGDYEIQVRGKRGLAFAEDHDLNRMIVTIIKGEEIILCDTQLTEPIQSIEFRDLDADGLIEMYVISVGGNGGYEYIDMMEIEGDELLTGDTDKIYGSHHFYFTEDRLVHKQYLTEGCCDILGLEFTYFKLVNNRFELEKRKEFIHSQGSPRNRSFVSN